MAELDAAVAGLPPLGPPGGRYANELFPGGRGAVRVRRPVTDPPSLGRVRPVDLPAAELAVVVHSGPHDDIDVTYGRLGAWVVGHALAVAGPVHETYLAGPHDDPDPATWRTEIRVPARALVVTAPPPRVSARARRGGAVSGMSGSFGRRPQCGQSHDAPLDLTQLVTAQGG
jgi:hypothetical protein